MRTGSPSPLRTRWRSCFWKASRPPRRKPGWECCWCLAATEPRPGSRYGGGGGWLRSLQHVRERPARRRGFGPTGPERSALRRHRRRTGGPQRGGAPLAARPRGFRYRISGACAGCAKRACGYKPSGRSHVPDRAAPPTRVQVRDNGGRVLLGYRAGLRVRRELAGRRPPGRRGAALTKFPADRDPGYERPTRPGGSPSGGASGAVGAGKNLGSRLRRHPGSRARKSSPDNHPATARREGLTEPAGCSSRNSKAAKQRRRSYCRPSS